MKINRQLLRNGVFQTYEEDVDFSEFELDPIRVKSIPNCHVSATCNDVGELLIVQIKIKTDVVGICAYTLDDVPLHYEIEDEIYFSENESDSDDCFYEPGSVIDLDPYILGIIFAEIPTKIVKPGAKLPEGGKGYRVISEDQYLKEQKNKASSCWDILDTIELDDDKN